MVDSKTTYEGYVLRTQGGNHMLSPKRKGCLSNYIKICSRGGNYPLSLFSVALPVVLSFLVLHTECMRPSRSGISHFKDDIAKSSYIEDNSLTPKQVEMVPVIINTWRFTTAAERGWEILQEGGSALDAVEGGCTACEELQCDRTVGFGGSPDENGETTLDAMIMDGATHSVGAVGCLRGVKNAVGVARKVMEHTKHTMLVGELATEFAVKMGFARENLSTSESTEMHQQWRANNCQPNFWKNVVPDPTTSCGPYSAVEGNKTEHELRKVDRFDHDTISMVAIDSKRQIASATSSNGARNKIPGRVGDAPITGAGSYVDRLVGGAAATGDGDVMVRFLPSLLAVESMRQGFSPKIACELAINRIAQYFPTFSGALIAVNLNGEHGGACHNIPGKFPYSVRSSLNDTVIVEEVECSMYNTRP